MLKTSSPAWRIWPDFSASIIASSSTIAPRAVLTRMTPGFIASMQAREIRPRVSSLSSRWIEIDVALGQQFVEIDEFDLRMFLRRPVPGDDAHAAAERDARDFGGDAAEADQAQRLAGQLHAVVAQPVAGADPAVHLGEAARALPHQRDRAFGDRRIAIALDQVHCDAESRRALPGSCSCARRCRETRRASARRISSRSRSAARCDRRSRSRRRRVSRDIDPR